MENVKSALAQENDFIINFVNHVLSLDKNAPTFLGLKRIEMCDAIFNSTSKILIKYVSDNYPHHKNLIDSKSLVKNQTRLLQSIIPELSKSEITELAHSQHDYPVKKFLLKITNLLTLGIFNKLVLGLYADVLDCDMSTFNEQQHKDFTVVLVYLSLLY